MTKPTGSPFSKVFHPGDPTVEVQRGGQVGDDDARGGAAKRTAWLVLMNLRRQGPAAVWQRGDGAVPRRWGIPRTRQDRGRSPSQHDPVRSDGQGPATIEGSSPSRTADRHRRLRTCCGTTARRRPPRASPRPAPPSAGDARYRTIHQPSASARVRRRPSPISARTSAGAPGGRRPLVAYRPVRGRRPDLATAFQVTDGDRPPRRAGRPVKGRVGRPASRG